MCDTVYKLLQDGSVPRLLEEDEIEEQDRKKLELQPKVYLPGDLQIQGSIGKLGRAMQKLVFRRQRNFHVTDLDLHCLQRVYPGSAGQGIIMSFTTYFFVK